MPAASNANGGKMSKDPAAKKRQTGNKKRFDLNDAARLAVSSGSAEQHLDRKRKVREKGCKLGLVVSNLHDQVTLAVSPWATPQAFDAENGGRPGRLKRGRKNLETKGSYRTDLKDQVILASPKATPISRDHKDGACDLDSVPVNSILGRQILLMDSGSEPTGSTTETASTGQLNPEHSRWLMGLPPGWSSCADTAMASWRSKRRRSSRRTSMNEGE